ncbi:hypothetical protein M9H77_36056 [Catharanthus roseus]|uniref:Uncharacterized protein n=1 Tax=Catharanthus roseus TaxID=4058 RepID=A0ACB9ZTA8_CATRO|nr:hypothetical protein M9H77_36056 [Catharanthus roseus]
MQNSTLLCRRRALVCYRKTKILCRIQFFCILLSGHTFYYDDESSIYKDAPILVKVLLDKIINYKAYNYFRASCKLLILAFSASQLPRWGFSVPDSGQKAAKIFPLLQAQPSRNIDIHRFLAADSAQSFGSSVADSVQNSWPDSDQNLTSGSVDSDQHYLPNSAAIFALDSVHIFHPDSVQKLAPNFHLLAGHLERFLDAHLPWSGAAFCDAWPSPFPKRIMTRQNNYD